MEQDQPFELNGTEAPGVVINEILVRLGLSLGQFAERMLLSPEDATKLLDGLLAISPDLAEHVEGSQTFWENRERNFVGDLLRLGRTRTSHAGRESSRKRVHDLIAEAVNPQTKAPSEILAQGSALIDELWDVIDRLRQEPGIDMSQQIEATRVPVKRPRVRYRGEVWFYGDACTCHRLYREDGAERFVFTDDCDPLEEILAEEE